MHTTCTTVWNNVTHGAPGVAFFIRILFVRADAHAFFHGWLARRRRRARLPGSANEDALRRRRGGHLEHALPRCGCTGPHILRARDGGGAFRRARDSFHAVDLNLHLAGHAPGAVGIAVREFIRRFDDGGEIIHESGGDKPW